MSNPFEAGNNEQGSTSKESVLDRHEVGANIRQLLSIATVTCASLFAPQTAEAKNPVQTGVETTTSASTAETPEDTLEAKAYQRLLALSVQLSESLCKDDELNACADALRAIAPKSESTGDESAYFNTAEGDASSGDPFTHMSQLDLVLKDFKNPKVFNMDVVKPRIDSFGATLSSGENGKILNELQREVEGLKTIFESLKSLVDLFGREA